MSITIPPIVYNLKDNTAAVDAYQAYVQMANNETGNYNQSNINKILREMIDDGVSAHDYATFMKDKFGLDFEESVEHYNQFKVNHPSGDRVLEQQV